MSTLEQNWIEEQQRVTDVVTKIGERIKELEAELGVVKTDVTDIRKHFWDDVTVNFNNPDDILETATSIKQQAEILSERERRHRHAAASLYKLTRLIRSPYFGRIDFTEEGEQYAEKVYLGIATFQDGEFGPFLIYDWRAPISSLYYDHSTGGASYQTPMGEIRGHIGLKRQFTIRDGKLHFMFDTGLTIGDELLQQVLSRNSDAQMKSIVATIQKEQNQMIRNDRCRMMIVQGAAGSGKTSVALQRVAYLLYKYRETLQSDQIVLFSPNSLFNSYVATVLPELGEENMRQTTFQEYLEHRLGSQFQLEDPFDQLEYMLTMEGSDGYQERLEGIRYKASPDYFIAMQAYKDSLLQEGMLFQPISFRGEVVIEEESLRDKFYGFDPAMRLLNRIEFMRDWLLSEVSLLEEKEIHKEWVEEAIELLTPSDYNRAFKELRRVQKGKGVAFDDFQTEKDILASMVVRRRLQPLKEGIKQLQFVAVTALYKQFCTDEALFARLSNSETIPSYWKDICRQTVEALERNELFYEDAAPYLFLHEMVKGFETNPSIRHVFIDEVQDYSPFELEFLKRLFPRCRMTALGDLNQAIFGHASASDEFQSLADLYSPEHTETYRLTRSYRSTREIVEFTRGMVWGGEQIEPFQRSGDKPRLSIASNREDLTGKIDAAIAFMKREGYESIGILCKTAAESEEAYNELKDRHPLRLIEKNTPAYEKGTMVIPVYLAKGVEFDAVIVYNGSQERYGRERDRKLFYTACTRAMHLLHMYSLGEPSFLITSQSPETYVHCD